MEPAVGGHPMIKRGLCDIGMIGLGTMGRNLVLNLADHGFSVAAYDAAPERVEALAAEAAGKKAVAAKSLKEFVRLLRKPRAAMILVPAGKAVDQVLSGLLPLLARGDIIIDGGNSHYIDTDRRAATAQTAGFRYLGVGVSGGEEGARHGPSLMPGGPPEAYERVRPLFEAIAARVGEEPCVTWLGPGSAGHYVKMVHNGIEYGLMRLIAETYDLMKRGLRLSNDQLHDVYAAWNRRALRGFLIEITARIFRQADEMTGRRLIDMILDEAGALGTGLWTSESAMELHVAAPTIDTAVAMRDLSGCKRCREEQAARLSGPSPVFRGRPEELIGRLESALYVGMVVTYSQGMALLGRASGVLKYGLKLDAIARIWRGGCIIRSQLLEDIMAAYRETPDLTSLLADRRLAGEVQARQDDLRAVVAAAVERGLPAPGFMASLAYLDSLRSPWLPDNLIQAQRDYFGAHTYHRVDRAGTFHTRWNSGEENA
jgi:6-phosphogluconate dehydrogenase